MAKRIIGALFIIIVFSVIVALFASFGMAQNNADGAPPVELLLLNGWCSDEGPDPPDFVENKDVASCSGAVLDTDADPLNLNDRFEFTIHNGYPGYECTFNLTVHNVGMETLWIWIDASSVSSTSPGEIHVSGLSVSPTSGELAPDDHAAGGADEAVVIFTVTVLQSAAQGTTYLNVIDGNIVIDDEPEPEPG